MMCQRTYVVRDMKEDSLELLFNQGIVTPFKSRFYLAECLRPLLEVKPKLASKRAGGVAVDGVW